MASVELEKHVYYEILGLTEGMYAHNEFILLSNKPFESYKDKGYWQLGKFIKGTSSLENLVIIPYNKETYPLLDITNWQRIPQGLNWSARKNGTLI